VARQNIEEVVSSYYPPRARWYRRIYAPWFALQRGLHLEKIHLPAGVTFQQFVLSLVIPGYAFFANGRPILGRAFLSAYGLGAVLFVVALGYSLGGLAYAVMISAHASSIVFLEGCWFRERLEFRFRLALAGLTLLAVWLAVYAPIIGYVEGHWIIPLRVRENVVVVHRLASVPVIQRGDYVMYSLHEGHNRLIHNQAVFVNSGFGWGPLLAVAGDRVEFTTNHVIVDGEARALLPHMPDRGGFVVPEKHWFVWPELDISGHGDVGEANISAMMMELAVVSESQFIGKPFKRWFFRRQIAP